MDKSLSERVNPLPAQVKPGVIGISAVYLVFAAMFMRSLSIEGLGSFLPRFIGLEVVFIFVYSLVLWKYTLPRWLMHIYFSFQSAFILLLLSIWPRFDFVMVCFLMLSYQVSLVFTGKMRWIWIGIFILLMGGSLIFYYGILRGLALSLTNIAGCIVVAAFISINHEIEQARIKSQALLSELQAAHKQLQAYAGQVDELTTMQERNRLARELHDTVSQMVFSISLTTRSAQLLLEKDTSRLFEQLQRLQEITTNALGQLRSLITQLRPPQE